MAPRFSLEVFRGQVRSRVVLGAVILVQRPDRVPDIPVRTSTEVELSAVVRDQQDLLFGLTVLLLRLLVTGTVGGLGLVLLAAGSTEWEVRSEYLRVARPSGGQ